jgi:hypothetical protein
MSSTSSVSASFSSVQVASVDIEVDVSVADLQHVNAGSMFDQFPIVGDFEFGMQNEGEFFHVKLQRGM